MVTPRNIDSFLTSAFTGPNSGTGHTSAVFAIETIVDLVIKLIRPIIQKKQAEIAVKYEYEKEYCDKQQAALQNRVWVDCRYEMQQLWLELCLDCLQELL
jgi:hypothetical protein